jgi:hypothetical protein
MGKGDFFYFIFSRHINVSLSTTSPERKKLTSGKTRIESRERDTFCF